ncbi:TetR family transcriptional regulator [Parvibaculum sedimenti]|uniref:TetR family transcriptional regulator n=1 Tax=Parvibaculum sedimenti TaxID=2608632 RepID=A0A6N6VLA4_9HYPH|nr:TetR/AcrR family transcriptional regulator [Parvibaculum sedimenti]KAB7739407.1 TetR family transcriptional regulator [Parvibaculum sedimenti]
MGLEEYRRSVSENKHAAILKAGRKHFLEHGYSGAAAADIAREADVSTATLYKHFSSKEELFVAVVKDADHEEEIPPFPDNASLEDTMVAVLNNYLITHFEKNATALLRIVIAEVPGAPDLARDTFNEFIVSRYQKLADIVDQLIAHGTLKPHDSHFGVRLLIGAIKEHYIWPALFDNKTTMPEHAEDVIRQVVKDYLRLYGT